MFAKSFVCMLRGQVTYRRGGGHTGRHCSRAGGAAAAKYPLLCALWGDSAGWQVVCVGGAVNNRAGQHFILFTANRTDVLPEHSDQAEQMLLIVKCRLNK